MVRLGNVIWLGNQLSNPGLMRVANHHRHARKLHQLFRRTLRITAGDHDTSIGILAMNSANDLPHFVIGSCSDSAGVQNHKLGGLMVRRRLESMLSEQRFNSCAISLRRAATEVCDVKRAHTSLSNYRRIKLDTT